MRRQKYNKGIGLLLTIVVLVAAAVPGFAAEQQSKQKSAIALTADEAQYVAEHPKVSIAIDTSWMPYGFSNQDGSCGGIIPNIINMVGERTGLQVELVAKETYQDAITACNTGETMLVSGIANDDRMSEKNGVLRTNPYIIIGYSAVTKRNISDLYAPGADYRVAICTGTYAKMAMEQQMPTYSFQEYHSNEECMNAVLNDETDIALIANYSAGYFSSWHEYSSLQIIQINDFIWGLCFGVNRDTDPMLIKVLNKGIASISENDLNQAIYGGAIEASSAQYRLLDVLYEQPALLAGLAAIVVAVVFLFVMQRKKMIELEKERQYKEDIHEKDLLLNSIPAGIGVFEIRDGVSHLRFMNDSFYRMLDDTRDARMKRTNGDFIQGIQEEDRPKVTAAVKQIDTGDEQSECTCRACKPDGTSKWIHVAALAAMREETCITVYCSLTDVDDTVRDRQKLQESADIIKAAMHSANMSVWNYDIEAHRIVQREESIVQHGFGTVVEDVPERLIACGYVHPDSAEAYRNAFAALEYTSEPVQGDYLVQTPDRSGYWWERMILTPVFEGEKLTKAIGTSINVNARKEKESRYLKLVDRMSDMDDDLLIAKGTYNLSKNIICYYSRKAEGSLYLSENCTYDYAVQEMVKTAQLSADGEKLAALLDRQRLISSYAEGKTEGSFEYKRFQENGRYIWSLLKYTTFEEPNSGDIMFFVYTYDSSERVLENRILTKLSSVEYEMLSIMDVATHHFILKNVIPGVEEPECISEGNYDEVMLSRMDTAVAPEEREHLKKQFSVEHITAMLEQREQYSILYSVQDNSGKFRRKKYQFCYLDETKTTLLYYRTDETELYNHEQEQLLRTEDALRQARIASHFKTEFFSRMSHDMRTPMNGILGIARLAEEETDPKALKESIRTIESSGEYLLGLINDTLDFQKIETGRMMLELQPVSLGEVVRSVIAMVKPTADQKQIQFQMAVRNADMDCHVSIDSMRMKQIFVNLISNAIKFTPTGGMVDVCFECVGHDGLIDHNVITISDTGIGMSEDFLKNDIFKPFSQEYNTVTASSAGSGLGLSIVKKLVELMNGTIHVESEQGVGTKFTVCIDFKRVEHVVEASGEEVHHAAGQLEQLSGKHVLLAEDHPLNAKIAMRLLTKVHCDVTWVKNGQECVDVYSAAAGQYDIILMDVRMPVLDGLAATKAIRRLERSHAKKIPIVAMTANAYSDDVKRCLEAGMNAHIAKPVEPMVMYETMLKAMN